MVCLVTTPEWSADFHYCTPRLPDYFQIIQKPISLKEIRQAINSGKCSSVRDLKVRSQPCLQQC